MTTLGGQWDGYLEGQDLTGLDRDRVRRLGHDYIERPSRRRAERRERSGTVLLTRLYLRNFRVYEDELDLELPPGWSASTAPTAPASRPCWRPSSGPCGARPGPPRSRSVRRAWAATASPRWSSSTKAISTWSAAR